MRCKLGAVRATIGAVTVIFINNTCPVVHTFVSVWVLNLLEMRILLIFRKKHKWNLTSESILTPAAVEYYMLRYFASCLIGLILAHVAFDWFLHSSTSAR